MNEMVLKGTSAKFGGIIEKMTSTRAVSMFAFVLALAAMMFVKVFAGTDTTAVDDLWTTFSGYAAGAPGKIIALLSFMSAIWYGIARPNYTLAIGSLMFCLMMANAKDIIEGFLTMAV